MQTKQLDKSGLDGTIAWGAEPGECSERTLTAGLAMGDREAFTTFVDRFKDALVGYLFRMCGQPGLAEDLAQESFLRFFKVSAREWSESFQPKAYLFRIGVNLLRSHERKRFRFHKIRSLLHDPADTVPDRDAVIRDETAAKVRDALVHLPIRFREPLVLHVLEGWSYDEIARHLNVGTGTVKSRIYRAKKRMRTRLQTYFKEDP